MGRLGARPTYMVHYSPQVEGVAPAMPPHIIPNLPFSTMSSSNRFTSILARIPGRSTLFRGDRPWDAGALPKLPTKKEKEKNFWPACRCSSGFLLTGGMASGPN